MNSRDIDIYRKIQKIKDMNESMRSAISRNEDREHVLSLLDEIELLTDEVICALIEEESE